MSATGRADSRHSSALMGRWPELLCAALLAQLVACGGSAESGSGGSAGTGSGGSPGTGGSGPTPPPAQGGTRFNFRPSMPLGADTCSVGFFSAGIAEGGAFPSYTSGNPGRRAVNGQNGAEVSCRVAGASQFVVSASIRRDNVSLSVTGTVQTGGQGTGTVTVSAPQTTQRPFGPIRSMGDPDCTLAVDQRALEVASGRIWSTFDCPSIHNEQDANVACGVFGEFVFENCEQ